MPWVTGEPIRVEIPGLPKPLQRQRHRIVTPRDGKQFVGNYQPSESRNEQAVIRDFAQQLMKGRPPFEGAIDLRFVAYMPVPNAWSKKRQAAALADEIRPCGRPDFDNLVKRIDAFKKIVWRDDAQVTDGGVWKRYSDRPRLVIEIRSLQFQPAQQVGVARRASKGAKGSPSTVPNGLGL